MIVLLMLTTAQTPWATSVATYQTKAECLEVLDETAKHYQRKFPQAILWCSEPIGYTGN